MKEYLDVLNDRGERTGIVKLRDKVHRDGDWHLSIHLWLACDDQILVQKRSIKKESNPGRFDASVAGHVSAGEDVMLAARRECEEEIGVDISNEEIEELGVLKLCIKHPERGFVSNEFNYVLLSEIASIQEFTIDEEEVEQLLWMGIEEIFEKIERNNKQFCISRDEINLIRNRFGEK